MKALTITLFVDDVRSALYFYEDLFSVDVAEIHTEDGIELDASMTILDYPFQLVKRPVLSRRGRDAIVFTLDVSEENLDALFDAALERDAKPINYPAVYLDAGVKVALFEDPFGFQWRLRTQFQPSFTPED
ncbi:MAG: hypothetical protein SPI65_02865 [Peptoniphilus sp.]|nr:VOC family protein [Peptoniphilus sp.]MDD7363173.1 hypothetical protein [Bacillota bacterium]MDY6044503.1 hypothetical protein [Peptoniphilus sp.]